MLRWITALILILLASTPAYSADFKWNDEHGQSFSLAELEGTPVVLHLWASWCPPCRTEMKAFSEWSETHSELTVLMVSLDRKHSDASSFLNSIDIDRPSLLSDASQARNLGARALPSTIIVAADGSIKQRYRGAHDWSDADFSKKVLSQLHP